MTVYYNENILTISKENQGWATDKYNWGEYTSGECHTTKEDALKFAYAINKLYKFKAIVIYDDNNELEKVIRYYENDDTDSEWF